MADYARPGNSARAARTQAESIRRLRTRRPLNGHVPAPTFGMEGPVSSARKFARSFVTLDPGGDGDYPEHKQIIAFHGYLDGDSAGDATATIQWTGNDEIIAGAESHIILSQTVNWLYLDEPYIINTDTYGGVWIRPEILSTLSVDADATLSCAFVIETVPV